MKKRPDKGFPTWDAGDMDRAKRLISAFPSPPEYDVEPEFAEGFAVALEYAREFADMLGSAIAEIDRLGLVRSTDMMTPLAIICPNCRAPADKVCMTYVEPDVASDLATRVHLYCAARIDAAFVQMAELCMKAKKS